jgi:hypothetical protein
LNLHAKVWTLQGAPKMISMSDYLRSLSKIKKISKKVNIKQDRKGVLICLKDHKCPIKMKRSNSFLEANLRDWTLAK